MLPLRFDNAFIRELPGEARDDRRPRQVFGALHSPARPTPVARQHLIAHSREMAQALGLREEDVRSERFAQVFAGNALLEGMQPYAANYGGHQFGNWAGQLGDGRAINLGEVVDARGARWELQLKGAGRTPYSRHADGRAVLRSSIREFLCSEAMHHLGIPTTRALCVVGTGEPVERDMFYDGRPRLEPGAVVCRAAPSFIRFGNFELPTSRDDVALLEKLADFTIRRDFGTMTREEWFAEVCERTARMVAGWMRVGFVHGVMNTDNMSILGLTLDYGPYGWIDDFDLDWTPNTTDRDGRRYRFGHQPQVAFWNLGRLANALLPLFASPDPLYAGLARFEEAFNAADQRNTGDKLGLARFSAEDAELLEALHRLLQAGEVDMTIFFRALATLDLEAPSLAPFEAAFYDAGKRAAVQAEFEAWLRDYAARVRQDGRPAAERARQMNAANPRYVLRNYLAQEAIERAEAGDFGAVAELLDVMRHPYDEQPGRERFAGRRPEWARNRPGCSMLSCSS